jgi:hypothetical protein
MALKHNSALRVRPRFGRIPTAVDYSGLGRSKLYIAASEHPELFRKHGSATIVDFDVLDQILDALPTGKMKPRHVPGQKADNSSSLT